MLTAWVSATIGVGASVWPHRRAQVPLSWLDSLELRRTALLWGSLLGTGVLTHIVSPVFYVLIGFLIAQPNWRLVILGATTYGLARGLTLPVALIAQARRDWTSGCAPAVGVGIGRRLHPVIGCVAIGGLLLLYLG